MSALFTDVRSMQRAADEWRREGRRIALVPTMGALHAGHLRLMEVARNLGDVLVASVFVNPIQFSPDEDFDRYPRNLERDCAEASKVGVDAVFAPDPSGMYLPGHSTFVVVENLTSRLEGAVRPGHFRGVATVVVKLLNAVKPHVAVFGQKDAQQAMVIRRLVRDLNMDTDLVIVPTVREPDGLAMSSRNAYLTPEQRKIAPVLHRSLRFAEEQLIGGMRDAALIRERMRAMIEGAGAGPIDYISLAHGETLEELSVVTPGDPVLVSLAVRFGTTRLIDNITLIV